MAHLLESVEIEAARMLKYLYGWSHTEDPIEHHSCGEGMFVVKYPFALLKGAS